MMTRVIINNNIKVRVGVVKGDFLLGIYYGN